MPTTTDTTKQGWQKLKLGDVCDVRDGTHDTPKKQVLGKSLITSKQLKNGIVLSTDYFISDEDFVSVNKRSKVDKNDVLISMIGTVGDTVFIKNEPNFAIKNIGLIKNSNPIQGQFVFYWLNSPSGKEEINKRLRGTSQKFISLGGLRELEIELPSLSEQKKIAEVLGAYDDLIEVNQKKIKILEELAQSIYKEWFVKPTQNRIPEGWEVKKVEDLIKRISVGKKYDNKTASSMGIVPILDQGRSGFIGYHNDEPGVIATPENPVIVFANHTCYENLIMFSFSAIQNVLPFVPIDEHDIMWLYYATKDLVSFNDYKGHWPELMAKRISIPSVELTQKFGEIIKPMLIQKLTLEKQNQNLQKTRDLLIPQLVGGKISLK